MYSNQDERTGYLCTLSQESLVESFWWSVNAWHFHTTTQVCIRVYHHCGRKKHLSLKYTYLGAHEWDTDNIHHTCITTVATAGLTYSLFYQHFIPVNHQLMPRVITAPLGTSSKVHKCSDWWTIQIQNVILRIPFLGPFLFSSFLASVFNKKGLNQKFFIEECNQGKRCWENKAISWKRKEHT